MELYENIIKLSSAAGIGEVAQVDEIIKEKLPKCAKVTVLTDGSICAKIDGKSDKTVMIEAHCDEVGFVVREVLDGGFLRLSEIGGIDDKILPSTRIKIFGKKCIQGVFCSTPPHLAKGKKTVKKIDELFVDCGTDVKNIVSVGDKAVFDIKAQIFGNRVCGKALDNRISVAIVLECAERAAKNVPENNVIFCFCKNEEVGLRGAKTAAFFSDICEAVAVDTTFGDMPQIPPYKTGKLGDGPLVGISPVLSDCVTDKLKKCAENVSVGCEVMGGNTGTDADVISVAKQGVATGLLSVPIRNMHTPVEVADLRDISAAADILTNYISGGAEK